MTLVRFREPNLDTIPKSFTDMLDSFFENAVNNNYAGRGFSPNVDIVEHDAMFEINVSLPGMRKDDINIEMEDNTLTISGERKHEAEDKSRRYHLVETRYGKFSRSFTLPRNINRDSIKATMKDGILRLEVEKSEDAVSRRIQIK
jgi:HSP20 family protein